MNLEKVAIDIRPRTSWEAIDIGFFLARRWYRKLWLIWILLAAPSLLLVIIAGMILPGASAKWALLLFWLLKPFYEPPVLSWIAGALFGEQKTTQEIIIDAKKALSRQWVFSMLLLRLSPFRSFSLPVMQLEKLEGTRKRQRLALLQDTSEMAVLLTVSGFFLELALTVSFLLTFFALIPEELRWLDFGDFGLLPDKWFLLPCYFASCSIIAPLYICSGFMMYISRRVQLEAWDLEIGFKRIRQRLTRQKNGLSRTLIGFLLLFITLASAPGIGQADEPHPLTAKAAITKILQQKEFGQKVTVYRWVPKEKETPDTKSDWEEFWIQFFTFLEELSKSIVPVIAKYGEFLLWCCAGGVIGFFLLKYLKLRKWLDWNYFRQVDNSAAPEIMFGLDLRPESLPEHIDTVCLKLLDDGKMREALSLLYRGTLSLLVNRRHLAIRSSFTEGECCEAVQKNRPTEESGFFNDLTSLWVFLAFGHRDLEVEACRSLVRQWQTLYGRPS
jgi:hypothetical protein